MNPAGADTAQIAPSQKPFATSAHMTNPHSDEPQSDVFRVARRFDPFESFVASANAEPGSYQAAHRDWVGFWEQQAKRLSW
jgi:hypothetical protein